MTDFRIRLQLFLRGLAYAVVLGTLGGGLFASVVLTTAAGFPLGALFGGGSGLILGVLYGVSAAVALPWLYERAPTREVFRRNVRWLSGATTGGGGLLIFGLLAGVGWLGRVAAGIAAVCSMWASGQLVVYYLRQVEPDGGSPKRKSKPSR